MVQEWTVYDSSKEDFIVVSADTWREAVLKAYRFKGFVPRRHLDVRPRTGQGVVPVEGFNSFVSKHF